MVGSALVEVCGSIIVGLTRGVAEHYNPNDTEFDPETFGFYPLETTGLEWVISSDEELIFQEYGDREIGRSAGNIFYDNVQPRLIDACSPDDQLKEDRTNEDQRVNRIMEWKQFRPSILSTLWNSMYFGFLISLLSAVLIGAFSILVYYLSYQTILVCLARPRESIPVKIQWSKTAFESTEAVFIHLSFFVNNLFYFKSYQIKGMKIKLFLISSFIFAFYVAYRIALQGLGASYSDLTPVQSILGNVIFLFSMCMQSWALAKHFFQAVRARKVKTFLWIIGSTLFTFIVATVVAYFIYPAYNKQDKTGKVYIALFTPLIGVVLKASSRLFVQRLWRISHPGKTFVYLVPLYYGSAVVLRLLQVDLDSLKAVVLIGVIHGIAEVIERSIIVLIDYIYHQIYERKRLPWGSFRTARRERLATDIAIMSMLYEASAVISVNGFLHLHEYFYTVDKTSLELLQSFAITTAVPLIIEWFFTCSSIAIETRYQNRPIMAVWRRQWKIHLTVAMGNTLPIAAWSSLNLLTAIEGRFPTVVDYCEMPFSHL